MLSFFIKFLRNALEVQEDIITFRVQCYLGNGLSLEDIETYWLSLLAMTQSQRRKFTVNNRPVSSQQKGRKLLYGVTELSVNSTRHIQHIYGAIQEYSGINKPEWLDLVHVGGSSQAFRSVSFS